MFTPKAVDPFWSDLESVMVFFCSHSGQVVQKLKKGLDGDTKNIFWGMVYTAYLAVCSSSADIVAYSEAVSFLFFSRKGGLI